MGDSGRLSGPVETTLKLCPSVVDWGYPHEQPCAAQAGPAQHFCPSGVTRAPLGHEPGHPAPGPSPGGPGSGTHLLPRAMDHPPSSVVSHPTAPSSYSDRTSTDEQRITLAWTGTAEPECDV